MNYRIGERLAKYRKRANMSQEELADKLNVSRQAVSKWERGESSPDTDNLIALAKLYNVTLDDLLNKDPVSTCFNEENETKDNKKDYVNIDKDGIHVKNEDCEVHIDANGIKTFNENRQEFIQDKINEGINRKNKYAIAKSIVYGALFLITVAVYLVLGFLLKDNDGWKIYWTLLFIPAILGSIVDCIESRRVTRFNITFTVLFAYLFVGMYLGIWHPTWVEFLAIPIFYSIVGPIEGKLKHNKYVKKEKDKVVVDIKE